ncbi:MAG: hypothetical protein WC712_04850 [Candidatus Brocadiia bacterium]
MKRILLIVFVLVVAAATAIWLTLEGSREPLPTPLPSTPVTTWPVSRDRCAHPILDGITPAVEAANPTVLRLKLACLLASERYPEAVDAARMLESADCYDAMDMLAVSFAYYCAGDVAEALGVAGEIERLTHCEPYPSQCVRSFNHFGAKMRMHLEMAEAIRSGSQKRMLDLLVEQKGIVLNDIVRAHPLFGATLTDEELAEKLGIQSGALWIRGDLLATLFCAWGFRNRLKNLLYDYDVVFKPRGPRRNPGEESQQERSAREYLMGGFLSFQSQDTWEGVQEIWRLDLLRNRKPDAFISYAKGLSDRVASYREIDLATMDDFLVLCQKLEYAWFLLAASTAPGDSAFPRWPDPVRHLLVNGQDSDGKWQWDSMDVPGLSQIRWDIARMLRNSCK